MKVKHCSAIVVPVLALMVSGCGRQEVSTTHPVRVKVIEVKPEQIAGGQHYSGTVEESAGSDLSFSVAGTVQQIRVEPGQRVAKGELIAVLDEVSLQNAYDASVALLEQAEDAWQRMKQLHDAGSLPEMQWVEVQSKLKQAQSAEAISKKSLADSKLYAPFSGVISEKSAEVGHNVLPGMPVVRLVDVGRVKITVSIPENEISRIALNQPVSVEVPALGGAQFSGKIAEKGIAAKALSRSYEVKAIVGNPSGELMPGMICTLGIGYGNDSSAIVLPVRVIQTDEANRCFVWVNDNGKAAKRIVEAGRLEKDGLQVTSGLEAGDEVIVEGQQKVSEGMDIDLEKN